MTVLFTVPRAVRGPLTVSIPSTSVPVGVTRLKFTINRFAWPEGNDVAYAELEYSLDSGSTWAGKFWIGMGGGSQPYKGNPDPPSFFSYVIPEPASSTRRIRGQVILNTALDCGAVIEGDAT